MLHNHLLPVEEYTTPSPVTVSWNQPISEVIEVLESHGFRHLPVVDDKFQPVGILSDRDLKVVSNFEHLESLRACDLMSADPYIVSSETPLVEVAMEMSRSKIGSAIVKYADDESYGLFTSTDALNALIEIVRGETFMTTNVDNPRLSSELQR